MVLQFSVDIFGDNRLYYFSPLSWLNINNLSVASFETFPNIYWVASVLSVAIIVEILIILASNTIFEISFES